MNPKKRPISKWEKLAEEAITKAIRKDHIRGIATFHADKNGIYQLTPDGQKIYIKKNERTK